MGYKLFTYPNCEHCNEIRKYFNERKIDYGDINIGLSSGKKDPYWRYIYQRHINKIETLRQKDEEGNLDFPILGEFNNGPESLERIAQGDDIKKLFE